MRVRLPLPSQWDFTCTFTIRVSDLNYGAHLANDRILTLAHEMRVRWLRSLGWNEMDIDGVGLIQVDAALQYKAQAFLGDALTGRLSVVEVSSRGFQLCYQLERESDQVEIARISTHLLFFNYANQTLGGTPAAFKKRFER